MIILENEQLRVQINRRGAELQSLLLKSNGLEYLWQADPAFWAKHSPLLFPIVGTLKNDTYYYRGQAYHMARHGFAREKDFSVEGSNDREAVFVLKDDDLTRKLYPFAFLLKLHYRLLDSNLYLRYQVQNPAKESLYFSIGGHPAFNVPLLPHTVYNDYYLEFNRAEKADRWTLENGLLKPEPEPFLDSSSHLALNRELFGNDAIVLKGLQSSIVSLRCHKSTHGLNFGIEGWPALGIWAAPGAPFVCIEPWCGHTDFVNHNQELSQKAGIIRLGPRGNWEKEWWVNLH